MMITLFHQHAAPTSRTNADCLHHSCRASLSSTSSRFSHRHGHDTMSREIYRQRSPNYEPLSSAASHPQAHLFGVDELRLRYHPLRLASDSPTQSTQLTRAIDVPYSHTAGDEGLTSRRAFSVGVM
ncbi:hypothetical protein SISSUDRAFT_434969 [Sistotremastrum suecicum HHB10207 ss-3]|uniref:Uncharacterized protein n=1 Tax=Sistotremastrum suecicum HHB10207 ss-3 TaxID=1314776 RepID=A0A165YFG3_9AGAM|nr:hypothetical protein SISSUDRAFT_434969 [Sistotremastrum suecicum HHB10207 ss-3]